VSSSLVFEVMATVIAHYVCVQAVCAHLVNSTAPRVVIEGAIAVDLEFLLVVSTSAQDMVL